jgi:uncharacterized protein with HEPN domain
MRPETEKLLWDVVRAADFIDLETVGLDFHTYDSVQSIQYSVERAFMIIGEAIRTISMTEPNVAQKIDSFREIIAFRNLIAHGYAELDNARVWAVIVSSLPILRAQAAELLGVPQRSNSSWFKTPPEK